MNKKILLGIVLGLALIGCGLKTNQVEAMTRQDGENTIIQCQDLNMYFSIKDLLSASIIDTQEELKAIKVPTVKLQEVEEVNFKGRAIYNIEGIEAFTNAKTINLSNNFIDNIEFLSGNINVESLFLDDNYLTEVNRTLSGLTKLEQITLAQNKIENLQLPTTNLKLLNANHNALKEVPEINSHKLEILILDHNQISSKSANLERIKEMPLQVLALHNNQLTDISDLFNITGKPENIKREPIMNLQYLSLSGNKISDITALQKLIKLKELHLQDNKITSIEELKELPLSFLNVANNQIQDMTWAYKIPQLGTFNITGQTFSLSIGEVKQKEIKKVKLPNIFLQAKDTQSPFYTPEAFLLQNATINLGGDVFTLKTDSIGEKEAVVVIKGGMADKTMVTIKYKVVGNSGENKVNIVNKIENQIKENQTIQNNTVENQTNKNNIVENQVSKNNTIENQTNQISNATNTTNSINQNTIIHNQTQDQKNNTQTVIQTTTNPKQINIDTTTSNQKIPNAGNDYIFTGIVISIVIAIIAYKKWRNMKEI